MLLWVSAYKSLCGHVFSFLRGKCPGGGFCNWGSNCQAFSKVALPFPFPPVRCDSPGYLTSSPAPRVLVHSVLTEISYTDSLKIRHLFLMFQRLGSSRSGASMVGFWWDTSSWLADGCLLAVSLCGWVRALVSLLVRTTIHHGAPPTWPHLNLIISEGPTLNTITLLGFSRYIWGDTFGTLHSALLFLLFCFSHSNRCMWTNPIVVSVGIPMMSGDIEHLFICFFALYISSTGICPIFTLNL